MGNSLSAAHSNATLSPTESMVSILLDFISNENAQVETLRVIYGPASSLYALAGLLRLPPYFQADLVTCREIFLAAATRWKEQVPENVDRLDKGTCNNVLAYVECLNQAEKLVSFITSLVIVHLKENFKKAVNQAPSIPRNCVLLLQHVSTILGVIIYACSGDPECFSSASTWLMRLELALLMLEKAFECAKRVQNVHLLKDFTHIANKDIESILIAISISFQERLLEEKDYEGVLELNSVTLTCSLECLVPVSMDLAGCLRLCLARTLIAMRKHEEGIMALLGFVFAFPKFSERLREAMLLDERTSEYEKIDQAVLYCLELPEVRVDVAVYVLVAKAMLLVSSRVESESSNKVLARDVILKSLVDISVSEGRLGEAFEVCDVIDDKTMHKDAVNVVTRAAICGDDFGKFCLYTWKELDRVQIKGILESIADRNSGSLDTCLLLYQWHITRRDYRLAAQSMYRFAQGICRKEAYFAMQLCHSCLLLASVEEQWILLPNSSQIIDLVTVEKTILLLQAKQILGLENSAVNSPRELIVNLLRRSQVEPAIALTLRFGSEWPLVTSFLVDSHSDGMRGDIDRPWLEDVTRAGCYAISAKGRLEEPENAILRYFLDKLDLEHRMEAYLGVIERYVAKRMEVPRWVIKQCLEQYECTVNDIVRILGCRGYLQLIAEILADGLVRKHLTAGTLAYLQILCE